MKNLVLILPVFFSLSLAAQDLVVRPKNYMETIQSLETQILREEQIRDIFDPLAPAPSETMGRVFSDFTIYEEGIPQGPNEGLDMTAFLDQAYTSVELINEARAEKMNFALGTRIPFMLEQAQAIVRASGKKVNETLMRYTLNRAMDMTAHLLPVAGANSELIAQWLVNFLDEHFVLAAGFANSNYVLKSKVYNPDPQTPEAYVFVQHAEFGRMYAQLLWNFSTSLTSETSKAVILMKILGYLGWDLNADNRRRETQGGPEGISGPIAKSIRDVYMVQHGPEYQEVLQALRNKRIPRTERLRSRVESVLRKLRSRVGEVRD